MENERIAVQNVKDVPDNGKRWLEEVLGHHLDDTQQVFIMVFTPGAPPSEACRKESRSGVQAARANVQKHMTEHGASDQEYDAAVDEAMERVRPLQRPHAEEDILLEQSVDPVVFRDFLARQVLTVARRAGV